MLCRACCSRGISETPWDNFHTEDDALVLGLIGSAGGVWVGTDGRMALAYGTVLLKTEMWFFICIAQGLGVTVVCDVHEQ